jgi:hypothetical protein
MPDFGVVFSELYLPWADIDRAVGHSIQIHQNSRFQNQLGLMTRYDLPLVSQAFEFFYQFANTCTVLLNLLAR